MIATLAYPPSVSAVPVSSQEGQSFDGQLATFTSGDPNASASQFSAQIDWGDGATSAGTVTAGQSGSFVVTGSQTYPDEGSYLLSVTVTDNTSQLSGQSSEQVPVTDAPLTAAPTSVTGTEGQAITGAQVATFSDQNPSATIADFTSGGGSTTINWGDGTTSAGTVTQTGTDPTTGDALFSVTGTHTSTDEGTYPVTVAIVDDGGSQATANGTAKVADAPLTATGNPAFVSTNPVSHVLATFTDQNPLATVADFTSGGGSTTISWGDGSTSAGTVTQTGKGQFSVSGAHSYAVLGPHTVTVSINDDGGQTASATTQVIMFAYAAGGSFVIGNGNSANGTAVTFWGPQWESDNSLNGGVAPSAFKGFEDGASPPSCGAAWTTDPGNSTPPPNGPLPTYMGVVVSSHVTQSGTVLSGDTDHIVVVKTNAGYAPAVGHAGTGTVVAQVC